MKRQIKALALSLLRGNVSNKLKHSMKGEYHPPAIQADNVKDVPGYPNSYL